LRSVGLFLLLVDRGRLVLYWDRFVWGRGRFVRGRSRVIFWGWGAIRSWLWPIGSRRLSIRGLIPFRKWGCRNSSNEKKNLQIWFIEITGIIVKSSIILN